MVWMVDSLFFLDLQHYHIISNCVYLVQVLNFTRFSSKSDVWAYGVLCWEVFTCGEMPYGRAKNPEVMAIDFDILRTNKKVRQCWEFMTF
jgi:hypothetical protein